MAKNKLLPLAERVKHDPNLLKRALQDPGLRSKLPAKYLTPGQRSSRKERVYLDSPVLPGADITNRALAQMRKAQETIQFGDATQNLKQQGYDLREQGKRDASFYDQYRQRIADAQDRQNTAAQQANQASAGVVASNTQASNTALDTQVAAAKADAAQRGLNFDEAAYRQLAQTATNNRAALQQGQVAQDAGNRYGQNAFLGGLSVSAQAAKGARADQITAAGQKLSLDKQALVNKKAAWDSNFNTQQLNDARQRILENKAYNLNVDKASASAATAAKNADTSASKANSWGYTPGEWEKLTPAQRNSIIIAQKKAGHAPPKPTKPKAHKWDSGASHIGTFKTLLGIATPHANSKTVGGSSMSLQTWLASEAKRQGVTVPHVLIVAAAEVAKDHYIHKATAEAIRKELNIRVTPFGYPVK